MGTREKLLSLLEQNRDRYLSGEEIAGLLNVSRTAVWKAVNSLRAAGWDVDAVSRRGYRLAAGTDVLSDAGIRKYLEPEWSGLTLEVLPETASTNDFLKEKAASGAPEGYVVTAGSQTAGKGRTGRSFFSPADTGVYLSLLLRPARYTPQQAVRLTTMAAVAACEAVSELTGEQAMIKWVNDIFLHGRKVSGILTEAALSLESGFLDFAVLGVGFNVYPPRGGFPGRTALCGGLRLSVSPQRWQKPSGRRISESILSLLYCFGGQRMGGGIPEAQPGRRKADSGASAGRPARSGSSGCGRELPSAGPV